MTFVDLNAGDVLTQKPCDDKTKTWRKVLSVKPRTGLTRVVTQRVSDKHHVEIFELPSSLVVE